MLIVLYICQVDALLQLQDQVAGNHVVCISRLTAVQVGTSIVQFFAACGY